MTPLPLVLSAVLHLAGQETPHPESQESLREQEPNAAQSALLPEEPIRTQYFYAPSGMMLRQGESLLSLSELLVPRLDYGLTDHVTLQVGSLFPPASLDRLGVVNVGLLGGIKLGGSLTDHFHLAVGVQEAYFISPQSQWFGMIYGTATYGTPDVHLSLTFGVPHQKDSGSRSGLTSPSYAFAFSGNLRVGRRVALVTENWLLPSMYVGSDLPLISSAGVRVFGDHWAVAVGLIHFHFPEYILGSRVSVAPWLDVSYVLGR